MQAAQTDFCPFLLKETLRFVNLQFHGLVLSWIRCLFGDHEIDWKRVQIRKCHPFVPMFESISTSLLCSQSLKLIAEKTRRNRLRLMTLTIVNTFKKEFKVDFLGTRFEIYLRHNVNNTPPVIYTTITNNFIISLKTRLANNKERRVLEKKTKGNITLRVSEKRKLTILEVFENIVWNSDMHHLLTNNHMQTEDQSKSLVFSWLHNISERCNISKSSVSITRRK